MQKSIVKKIAFVSSVFGINIGTIATFIWSIRLEKGQGLKVIGPVELHPPFFLILGCIVTSVTVGVVVTVFWMEIQGLRPSVQFSKLYPEIVSCRDEAAKLMRIEGFDPQWFTSILELQYEFERLEIPNPMKDLSGLKTPDQFSVWKKSLFVFFQKMLVLSKHRELNKARAYWKNREA